MKRWDRMGDPSVPVSPLKQGGEEEQELRAQEGSPLGMPP